ncbi:MAG TPA: sugar transferase [Propionibacteriaceae bacterium]
MTAQPSTYKPATLAPPVPAAPAVAVAEIANTVPSWLLGFHGTVSTSGIDGDQPPTLRSIALSRRSLGTERMSRLTDLPSLRRSLVAPNSGNGALPVGAGCAGPDELVAMLPGWEPWSDDEPLDAYIDRRLIQARVLYLPNRGRAYAACKRLLDIAGSLALLLVAAPVMLVLAVLIRRDSPGPAVFAQQRVTRGGELFTFYKFRTMWVDAKERFPALYDYAGMGARGDVYYKLEDDPRSTKVGRWLRRTTLDELPNLFNVLRGDMSLVGPRPELPGLVPLYQPEDLALFFTKSGLTGLAQVAGRSLLTVRERIGIDLRYVANQTLLLDIRILIGTVGAVVLRRGAF